MGAEERMSFTVNYICDLLMHLQRHGSGHSEHKHHANTTALEHSSMFGVGLLKTEI